MKAQSKTTQLFLSGSGTFIPADNRAYMFGLHNDGLFRIKSMLS